MNMQKSLIKLEKSLHKANLHFYKSFLYFYIPKENNSAVRTGGLRWWWSGGCRVMENIANLQLENIYLNDKTFRFGK